MHPILTNIFIQFSLSLLTSFITIVLFLYALVPGCTNVAPQLQETMHFDILYPLHHCYDILACGHTNAKQGLPSSYITSIIMMKLVIGPPLPKLANLFHTYSFLQTPNIDHFDQDFWIPDCTLIGAIYC